MKKLRFVMFLIVVAFLVMGQSNCEGGGNKPVKNKIDPYIGGTDGLEIQFADEAPPTEVFDGGSDPFDIELILQNVGEAPINRENVKIMIEGLHPGDFGKTQSDFIVNGINEDIEATYKDFDGNKLLSPDVYITFNNLNFQGTLPGNKNYPIWASICYNYKTEALADGCIRKNPRSTEEGVCEVNEEKIVYSSSAPVQVTQFLEQPSGQTTVKYLFTIKHQGSGKIYSPLSKCPSDDTSQEGVIKYNIESSVSDLICSGADGTGKSGSIKLRPGQEYVLRCTQQKESQLDFIDSIFMTLEYDYKISTPETILIKKNI